MEESDILASQIDDFLSAWFRTRQTIMEANFHRAHQHGLSTTQFLLLNLLDQRGSMSLRSAAGALHLDTSTLVQTVDSLETRGLVQRQRSTQDRRRVDLLLTEAGRGVQAASQDLFRQRLTVLFATMTPVARQALIEGMTAFADAAMSTPEENHATDVH